MTKEQLIDNLFEDLKGTVTHRDLEWVVSETVKWYGANPDCPICNEPIVKLDGIALRQMKREGKV